MPLQVRTKPPLNSRFIFVHEDEFQKLHKAKKESHKFADLRFPSGIGYCLDSKGFVWYEALPTKTWFAGDELPNRSQKSLWFSRDESPTTFTERMYYECRGRPDVSPHREPRGSAWVADFAYFNHTKECYSMCSLSHIHVDSERLHSSHGCPYVMFPDFKVERVEFGHFLNHNFRQDGSTNPPLFYPSQSLGFWVLFDGSETRFKLMQQLRTGRRDRRKRLTQKAPDGKEHPFDLLLGELYFLDDAGDYHVWSETDRVWRNTHASLSDALARLREEVQDYPRSDAWFYKQLTAKFPVLRVRLDKDNEFGQHLWLFAEPGKPENTLDAARRYPVRYLRHFRIVKSEEGQFYWSYDIPASPMSPVGEQRGLTWFAGGSTPAALRAALMANQEQRAARIAPLQTFDELTPYEIYEDSRGVLFYSHDNGQIGLWNAREHYWLNTEMQLRTFQEFMLNCYEHNRGQSFVPSKPRNRSRTTQPHGQAPGPTLTLVPTTSPPTKTNAAPIAAPNPVPVVTTSTAHPTPSQAQPQPTQQIAAPPPPPKQEPIPVPPPVEPPTQSQRPPKTFDPSRFPRLDVPDEAD